MISTHKFRDKWATLMFNLNVLNHDGDSYGPNDVAFTDYGVSMVIKIPLGFDYEHFLTLRSKIETAFCSKLICNYRGITSSSMSENDLIDIELISEIRMNESYNLVKTDMVHEIYLSNDYKGRPIKIDLTKYAGVLINGAQRSGKTKMLQMILSNIVNTHGKDKALLFLYQIDRSDLYLLKNYATDFVSGDYDKMLDSLRRVDRIMEQRDRLLQPLIGSGRISNYVDYNNLKRASTLKPMPDIFIGIDEIASLQKGTSSTKIVREEIVSLIGKISRMGTGLGVHLLLSIQRSDSNSLDSSIKSLCGVVVSFRANNAKSSEVMIDDNSAALGLKEREFVYKLGNVYKYGVVPYIDTEKLSIRKEII